jgi:hypothetical protein
MRVFGQWNINGIAILGKCGDVAHFPFFDYCNKQNEIFVGFLFSQLEKHPPQYFFPKKGFGQNNAYVRTQPFAQFSSKSHVCIGIEREKHTFVQVLATIRKNEVRILYCW